MWNTVGILWYDNNTEISIRADRMNVQKVLSELAGAYPGKNIIQNNETDPTEIVCETDPAADHPEYSVAVAVIDKSLPHKHIKTTEEYKVIKGSLTLFIGGRQYFLHEGETMVIAPNSVHRAIGQETWVATTSRPGWTPEDHILQDNRGNNQS